MTRAEVRALLQEEYDNITLHAKVKATTNNELWLATAEELYKTQSQLKQIAAQEKDLKEKLKVLSGNETMTVGQFEFVKEERKGSISYTSIPFLKELDLEKYRNKPVEAWKLKVKALLDGND